MSIQEVIDELLELSTMIDDCARRETCERCFYRDKCDEWSYDHQMRIYDYALEYLREYQKLKEQTR